MNQIITDQIAKVMADKNMTQGEISRKSGMDRSHVTRMLNGRAGVVPKAWETLFELLGVELCIRPVGSAPADAPALPPLTMEYLAGLNRAAVLRVAEQRGLESVTAHESRWPHVTQLREAVLAADAGQPTPEPAAPIQAQEAAPPAPAPTPEPAGRPKPTTAVGEALWEETLKLPWPLSPSRMASALYGGTSKEIQRCRDLLAKWAKQGRVVRVGTGEYDLPTSQQNRA